jgi:formamidopyrimidine-DNA glycosylase
MPELPEVEFAVRWLRGVIVGRRVTAIEVHHRSQARQLPPRDRARLTGRRVTAIERRGKHQLLHLDDRAALLVHFRLDGDWAEVARGGPRPPHTRVTLRFGRRALALTDPRALCTVRYVRAGADPGLDLGPEPEDPSITPALLRARLVLRRAPIKPLLLDQRLLAGVGNIYATEACWHARIDPATRADRLSLPEVARLLRGLRRTLGDGHENAGRYHRGERAIPFEAYDRAGAPCTRCGTRIRRIEQAGRGTWFCPRCQRASAGLIPRPRAARP